MVIAVLVVVLSYFVYGAVLDTDSPVAAGLQSLLGPPNGSSVNIPQQINRGYVTANP